MLPTFRSLAAAIDEAADRLVTTEVAIVEDKADAPTRSAVKRILDSDLLSRATRVQVIPTDHGDLSLARNSGISATDAPCVGVLDADNLVSPNWIHAARERIQTFGGDCVVHPEHMLTFDLSLTYSEVFSCGEDRTRLGHLNRINLWDAFMMTTRGVAEGFPYPVCRPESGFGPEDWAWNCATLDGGIDHVTAPGTSFFYQVRSLGSLRVAHADSLLPKAAVLGDKEIAVFEARQLGNEVEAALAAIFPPEMGPEPEPAPDPEENQELEAEPEIPDSETTPEPSTARRAIAYARNNSLLFRAGYASVRNLARKAGLVPTPPTPEEIAAAEAEAARIRAEEEAARKAAEERRAADEAAAEAARIAALPNARNLPAAHWELAHRFQPLIPARTETLAESVPVKNLFEYSLQLLARHAYWQAVNAFPANPDLLIVTPRLSEAAAAYAWQAETRGERAAVLVTEDFRGERDCGAKIPASASVCRWRIEIDPRLEFTRQLGQLAVQLAPARLLVVDDALGNEAVDRYATALRAASEIRVVFSESSDGTNAAASIAGCSPEYLAGVEATAASGKIRDAVALDGGVDAGDIRLEAIPALPEAACEAANARARQDGGPASPEPAAAATPSPCLCYWASHETAEALRAGRVVLLYNGADGTSNFGDILQNKNVHRYWAARGDLVPILLVPSQALSEPGRLADLQRWHTPHILAFGTEEPARAADFARLEPCGPVAAMHIVGGGYINAIWGAAHIERLAAVAAGWEPDSVFASGLQVDEAGVAGLASLHASGLPLRVLGFRDYLSTDLATRAGLANIRFTFDDLTEVLQEWAGSPVPLPCGTAAGGTEPDGGAVALHVNTTGYTGPDSAGRWRSILPDVAATGRRALLLDSYADRTGIIDDSLRSTANMAEAFPFARYEVISTARTALEWQPGAGLPAELAPVRGIWAGLASSYHTALMLGFLGTPAYLVSSSGYFSQKAAIFNLPPLEDFLDAPEKYALTLDTEIAARGAWIEELDAFRF